MCQVGDLLFEKVTLWWFQFQIMLSKVVKNNMLMVEMFFLSVWEDNCVVKINEAVYHI